MSVRCYEGAVSEGAIVRGPLVRVLVMVLLVMVLLVRVLCLLAVQVVHHTAHFCKACSLILKEVPHNCAISMSTDDTLTRRTANQPTNQPSIAQRARHKKFSNLVVMETTYDSVAYMVCDLLPLAPAILT